MRDDSRIGEQSDDELSSLCAFVDDIDDAGMDDVARYAEVYRFTHKYIAPLKTSVVCISSVIELQLFKDYRH